MKKYLILLVIFLAACQPVILEFEKTIDPVVERPEIVQKLDLTQTIDLRDSYIYSVAVADFNNDGYDDVVTGDFNGISMIFLNNKDNTFTETPIVFEAYNTQAVAAIDIDGDGYKDLILGNRDDPTLILKNNQDATFTVFKDLGRTNVRDIVVADFDNDGREDFAIITQFKDNFVYFNDGEEFSKVKFSSTLAATSAGVIDFNNDGLKDIVIGLTRKPIKIYMNEGNRNFVLARELPGLDNTEDIEVSDLDKDGFEDIIQGNNKGENKVFMNSAEGFTEKKMFGIGNTYAVLAADLDGDGFDEVIIGNYEETVLVYKKQGNIFTGITELDGATRKNYVRALAVGDFNNDGKLDVVVARETEMTQIYLS